jgi:hypothetical protein
MTNKTNNTKIAAVDEKTPPTPDIGTPSLGGLIPTIEAVCRLPTDYVPR